MVTFARGTAKTVVLAPELVSFGTPGAGPGQLLRRVSSDLNLNVSPIDSQEILPSQQMRDSRLGPRQVSGTLSGQLSPASYALLFQGLLRGTFTTSGSAPQVTDCTGAVDAFGNLVLTSASANFANSGVSVGDIIRITQASNTNINFRVLNSTATTMALAPIGGVATAFGAGNNALVGVGKQLIVPQAAAQLDRSFSIEHWYADVAQSELFLGVKVTQLSLNVPASGFVTLQASWTGQDMRAGTTQVYAAPSAVSTTPSLTATSGRVIYGNSTLAYLTSLNLTMMTQAAAPNTVGSNIAPAIFVSQIGVRGSCSALMTTDTLTADFLAENEVSLSVTMTSSPAANADFVSLFLPRVKLNSSTKSDSPSSITRSFNFTALEYIGGAANTDATTVVVSDSLA